MDLKFHNGGDKGTKILIKAKQTNLFFNERKRAKIRSIKCCLRNMMNAIVYRMSTLKKKEIYVMLCFGMVWYGNYGMLWNFFATLWDFNAMPAKVYVAKDKHSGTV